MSLLHYRKRMLLTKSLILDWDVSYPETMPNRGIRAGHAICVRFEPGKCHGLDCLLRNASLNSKRKNKIDCFQSRWRTKYVT